jgi:DNA-binding GntR family transcriptional regulator
MHGHLPSIDVSTLQERVYQSLCLALLSGQFVPGDVVSIRKVANALGTSAMPVREALKRLIAEKALVQSSDRLIRVAPYDLQEHEEYIRIRIQMEGYAAERAALVCKDAGLVERLADHDRAMVESAKQSRPEAALAANYAFHFELYGAAGYPQLVDILASLWLRTGPFLATVRRKPAEAVTFFENGHIFHARVMAAITNRDRKAARRAIAMDIRTATMWLRKNYRSDEEPTGPDETIELLGAPG